MKKFLPESKINQLSTKDMLKYRKEMREYYPILKEHILLFAKSYAQLEKLMQNRADSLQSLCDKLAEERIDSSENDANLFNIQ
jgi:hypothetical protein